MLKGSQGVFCTRNTESLSYSLFQVFVMKSLITQLEEQLKALVSNTDIRFIRLLF